ncbi:MAG: Mu-like prophage major head subunit gpT family protein [Planctomycetes bacterium]|nr:Mu-like prophage major head subunit gpT family protein [Planctomycetota bacterium]
MAAIVGTGLNLAGARSEFFKIFDSASATAFFNEWCTHYASNKDIERHRWIGSVPPLREWGTGRLARGLASESYDVDNLKYEATISCDRSEIADDQTGQIMLRIRELAQRAAEHKDAVLATLLANGDQAGYLSYDGKIFFAADHESGASGAQSNILTPAAVDADDPTAAEFKTGMKSALSTLLALKDDFFEPINLTASGLVAVVPPSMYITAVEALSATVLDATTNVLSGAAKVVPFARLTDASKWFLLKTDRVMRPFIFQDREPIEFNSLERDSESGFLREVYLYGVRARYRVTYGAWQHAVQLTFVE